MKNWKQRAFAAIIVIIGIIIGFTACDNNNDSTHAHEFSTVWEKDGTQHWHECSCGEKADVANHTWGNWIETLAPTVTEDGEETRTCTVCGETETRPATHTHEYGTVWEKDGTQHWHECSCGEKVDIANHTWGNWTETLAPTTTADGEETRTCSICGKTETRPIDQLITFTVTFDADNGTTPATQTITEGNTAVKPADPEKTDHHFDYWFNTVTTTEWDFSTPITADVSLKAKWTETPIEKTATITLSFGAFVHDGTSYDASTPTVTITGTFTNTEWTDIPNKIKTALNERFAEVSSSQQRAFRTVYTEKSVTIVLEKNPAYANYNAPTFMGNTVYINFSILDDKEALGLALTRTNQVMYGNSGTPQEG
jgi:hypothetical protein